MIFAITVLCSVQIEIWIWFFILILLQECLSHRVFREYKLMPCRILLLWISKKKELQETQCRCSCTSLSSRCLSLLLFSGFSDWQHSHCDCLQPLFKISRFGCEYPYQRRCSCACESRLRASAVSLNVVRQEREGREGGGDTPLCQSGPVSLLWPSSLRGDRSLHTVRCLHPLLQLSEISSIPRHLRNPACLCSLTVHWTQSPDGRLYSAGCSLKVSSNIL